MKISLDKADLNGYSINDRQIVGKKRNIVMRIVKEAEERKNEILDAAEKLFACKGFDATSTNDILNEVKIARGTLYYHFKSKEDILDAMICRMTGQLMVTAAMIAKQTDIPLLERLAKTIISLNVNSSLGMEVMEQMHKPQNALMHQKMQEQLLSGIVPILTELVKEGINEGILSTDYPTETVEMLILYSGEAFDTLKEQTEAERQQRMQGFIYNTERLLGTKPGVLQETLMQIFMANAGN